MRMMIWPKFTHKTGRKSDIAVSNVRIFALWWITYANKKTGYNLVLLFSNNLSWNLHSYGNI